jgi:transcriptional regulator with XRE-family HTH domain
MPRRRDNELLDQVGRRIQRLRLERGLTQRQLAEAVGVEPESVSRAETGSISFSLTNLSEVARVLCVGLGDLVDCERPAPPAPPPPQDHEELLRAFTALDATGRVAALGAVRGIGEALGARRG